VISLSSFSFGKTGEKSPDVIGNELGEEVKNQIDFVENFNVVKVFLTLKSKINCSLSNYLKSTTILTT
jgi:hypothetical protein